MKTPRAIYHLLLALFIGAAFLCTSPELHAKQGADQVFGFEIYPGVVRPSSPCQSFLFSLSIFYGSNCGVHVLEIGGLANMSEKTSYGLQIAGLMNGNDEIYGLQLAGFLNVAFEKVVGIQLGAINWTPEITGIQLGFGNFASKKLSGLQIGLTNSALKEMTGMQLGLVNWHPKFSGTKYVHTKITGMQVSLINTAYTVSGIQLGLINESTSTHGLQIGLINISSHTDASIGLLNFSDKSIFDIEAFASDDGLAMLGFRHQASALYHTYFLGTRLTKDDDLTFAFGMGIGWRTPITTNFEFSIDTTTTLALGPENSRSNINTLQKLRPLLTWQPTNAFALFAGPTLNLQFIATDSESFAPIHSWGLTNNIALWPGFTLGARLTL